MSTDPLNNENTIKIINESSSLSCASLVSSVSSKYRNNRIQKFSSKNLNSVHKAITTHNNAIVNGPNYGNNYAKNNSKNMHNTAVPGRNITQNRNLMFKNKINIVSAPPPLNTPSLKSEKIALLEGETILSCDSIKKKRTNSISTEPEIDEYNNKNCFSQTTWAKTLATRQKNQYIRSLDKCPSASTLSTDSEQELHKNIVEECNPENKNKVNIFNLFNTNSASEKWGDMEEEMKTEETDQEPEHENLDNQLESCNAGSITTLEEKNGFEINRIQCRENHYVSESMSNKKQDKDVNFFMQVSFADKVRSYGVSENNDKHEMSRTNVVNPLTDNENQKENNHDKGKSYNTRCCSIQPEDGRHIIGHSTTSDRPKLLFDPETGKMVEPHQVSIGQRPISRPCKNKIMQRKYPDRPIKNEHIKQIWRTKTKKSIPETSNFSNGRDNITNKLSKDVNNISMIQDLRKSEIFGRILQDKITIKKIADKSENKGISKGTNNTDSFMSHLSKPVVQKSGRNSISSSVQHKTRRYKELNKSNKKVEDLSVENDRIYRKPKIKVRYVARASLKKKVVIAPPQFKTSSVVPINSGMVVVHSDVAFEFTPENISVKHLQAEGFQEVKSRRTLLAEKRQRARGVSTLKVMNQQNRRHGKPSKFKNNDKNFVKNNTSTMKYRLKSTECITKVKKPIEIKYKKKNLTTRLSNSHKDAISLATVKKSPKNTKVSKNISERKHESQDNTDNTKIERYINIRYKKKNLKYRPKESVKSNQSINIKPIKAQSKPSADNVEDKTRKYKKEAKDIRNSAVTKKGRRKGTIKGKRTEL